MRSCITWRTLSGAAWLFALALLGGCSSIAVESDWDTSVDFSQFQTYGFIDDSGQGINRLTNDRIRAAINSDLTGKGFRPVNDYEDADIAIGYQVTTEQRSTYHTVHSGWGASGFRTSNVRLGASVGTSRTVRNDYTVGTLVIAVFQVADKTLIWEGSGTDTVSPSRSPDESTQNINEAVQKILRSFPPGIQPGE